MLPQLASAALAILALALVKENGRLQFCTFAAFTPPRSRVVTPDRGCIEHWAPRRGGAGRTLANRLLLFARFGSRGTLAEVLRGHTGDRQAPQRCADDETVQAGPLAPIQGSFFPLAEGNGFQRPFEWAMLLLRNRAEVMPIGAPTSLLTPLPSSPPARSCWMQMVPGSTATRIGAAWVSRLTKPGR